MASPWMLELLLLLQRDPQSSWSCAALVRELRGTVELVIQNLGLLITAGLVAQVDDGSYGYRAKRPNSRRWSPLSRSYAQKRVTVLHTIFAPSEKIGR